MMQIVVDLDDTICVHQKRDFANALPVTQTIEKIKRLKEMGCSIIVYTARGQNSCNGDLSRIKEKYEESISCWLKEHDVPFDKLVFGKPLGDLYVDDKGISLNDFLEIDFEEMRGNSGSKIFKVGNQVVKQCRNSWEQYDWYKKADSYGINVPKVQAVVLDKITMEYAGCRIKDINQSVLNKILSNVFLFQHITDGSDFNAEALVKRVDEHLRSKDVRQAFQKTKQFLMQESDFLRRNATFSHGDLSLSNCLLNGGDVYLIDPNQNKEYSSYLLDFAKLMFSLDDGEKFLRGEEPAGTNDAQLLLGKIIANMNLTKVVKALEITHWLRLLKYESKQDRVEKIVGKALALEAEL